MSAGSPEPEGDDDHQCIHCGRWYSRAGLQSHEDNCDWQQTDKRLHDLEDPLAIMRVDDVDASDFEEDVDVDDIPAGGPDAVRVESPEPEDAGGSDPEPARTDGSGAQSVPGGWGSDDGAGEAASVDVDVDDQEASCPSCGSTDCSPIRELPDELLEAEPELRDYDRVCNDCSTAEGGRLTSPVEVFRVDE